MAPAACGIDVQSIDRSVVIAGVAAGALPEPLGCTASDAATIAAAKRNCNAIRSDTSNMT